MKNQKLKSPSTQDTLLLVQRELSQFYAFETDSQALTELNQLIAKQKSFFNQEFWVQVTIRDQNERVINSKATDLDFQLFIPEHITDEEDYVKREFLKMYKTLHHLMPDYSINMTAHLKWGVDKHSQTWTSWYSYYGTENRFVVHT